MSCAIADTQITTTSNGGCKNRSRIDMEICPKQQDTALNLLVKTPRFSQTCAGRELLPVAQHLSRHSPGSGTSQPTAKARIQEQPHFVPSTLQNPGPSKSKQCSGSRSSPAIITSIESTASPPSRAVWGWGNVPGTGNHNQ